MAKNNCDFFRGEWLFNRKPRICYMDGTFWSVAEIFAINYNKGKIFVIFLSIISTIMTDKSAESYYEVPHILILLAKMSQKLIFVDFDIALKKKLIRCFF